MKQLKPDPQRGALALIGMTLMTIGAGILWGAGAALLVVGIVLFLDAETDEIVERISDTKRASSLTVEEIKS